MARQARILLPHIPAHLVQRGHNRSPCFFTPADRARYLALLGEHAVGQRVAIHAYVLMTNHVHLLVSAVDPGGIGRMMKAVGERYVDYINRLHRRSGTLWGGRFWSGLIEADDHFLVCSRYIELNPVRAGIVADPARYEWSSYGVNALGATDPLVTPHELMRALGRNASERCQAYVELFEQQIPGSMLERIRKSVRLGLPVGSDDFVQRVSERIGRKLFPGKVGRPPRNGK
jgi:putative transposase